MPEYQTLTTDDVEGVAESLKNGFRPFWESLPICEVKDYRNGVKKTTYDLPKNEASLLTEGGMTEYRTGQRIKEGKEIPSAEIAIKPRTRESDPYPYPTQADREHLIEDLNNAGPIHLDFANRDIDLTLAGAYKNTTVWGAATSFTGANPLRQLGADTQPLADMEEAITSNNFDDYRAMGLSLEMHVSGDVLRVFGLHRDFHGGGTGSATSSGVAQSQVIAILREILGLDRVVTLEGVYNNAQEGATVNVSKIASEVCWLGLVDRRRAVWDLKNRPQGGMNGGPNGAIAIGLSQRPDIELLTEETSRAQYTVGINGFEVYFPQYQMNNATPLGMFFDNIRS